MKFINNGETVQVRKSDGPGRYKWKLLKKGETIYLPKAVGKRYGFKKVESNKMLQNVTEGKIGETKVETKQFESEKDFIKNQSNFRFELNEIKGIGLKTVLDIIKIFPTKEKLIEVIEVGDSLPFRDDIETKLRQKYGGKK